MRTLKRTLVLVALLSTAASGMGQDPLVAAVQKRQELVRSVDIKFHIKEFEAKGSHSADAAISPGGKAGLVIPAQDTTMESDNRLVLDASAKVRFENNHPMWSLPGGELTQKQALSATNGELAKVFYPEAGSESVPKSKASCVGMWHASWRSVLFI